MVNGLVDASDVFNLAQHLARRRTRFAPCALPLTHAIPRPRPGLVTHVLVVLQVFLAAGAHVVALGAHFSVVVHPVALRRLVAQLVAVRRALGAGSSVSARVPLDRAEPVIHFALAGKNLVERLHLASIDRGGLRGCVHIEVGIGAPPVEVILLASSLSVLISGTDSVRFADETILVLRAREDFKAVDVHPLPVVSHL